MGVIVGVAVGAVALVLVAVAAAYFWLRARKQRGGRSSSNKKNGKSLLPVTKGKATSHKRTLFRLQTSQALCSCCFTLQLEGTD